MAFLRNIYLLIDFGNDFVAETKGTKVLNGTDNNADPFIQLLSTSTDGAQLHNDFAKARLSTIGGSRTSRNLNMIQVKQMATGGHQIAKGVIIGVSLQG